MREGGGTKSAACWDCRTLEMSDTLVGLAELFGWGGVGALHGRDESDPAGTGGSVLDCLIAAEAILQRRR